MSEGVITDPEYRYDNIRINEALPEDARAIHELRKAVWLTTYTRLYENVTPEAVEDNFKDIDIFTKNTQEAIVNDPKLRFVVAKDGEKLVGFCLASIKKSGERWIDSLYVLDDYQGQGIGEKLAFDEAQWLEADKYPVHLEVGDLNEKAKKIYERWGFEVYRHVEPDESFALKMPQFEMIRPPTPLS